MSVLVPYTTDSYIDSTNRKVTVLSYKLMNPTGNSELDIATLKKDLTDTVHGLLSLTNPRIVISAQAYAQAMTFDISYVDKSQATYLELAKAELDWVTGLLDQVNTVYLQPAIGFVKDVASDLGTTFKFGVPAIALLAVGYLLISRRV